MADAVQSDFIAGGIIDQTNGLPLAGGKLRFFDAGTTNPTVVFQDVKKTTPFTQPVILDAQGKKTVFIDGDVKIQIDDANDVTQETLDNFNYTRVDESTVNRDVDFVSSTTTLTTDQDLILVNTSTGNVTVNLPTASGLKGKEYIIKKITSDANTVTVDPSGTETIDGNPTFIITADQESLIIRSDDVNWQGIGLTAANSDKLDGLDSTQFLRSDVDDDVDGNLTLANAINLFGKETGGIARNLISMSPTDFVGVGDVATITDIRGSLVTINGNLAFHAGNDGSGSGLDADLLDAIQGSQFLRSDVADEKTAGDLTLANSLNLRGKDTGAVARNLITMSPGNVATIGDIATATNIVGTPDPTANGNTIHTTTNGGDGTGFDADFWHGQRPKVGRADLAPGDTESAGSFTPVTGSSINIFNADIGSNTFALFRVTIEYQTSNPNDRIEAHVLVDGVAQRDWIDTSTGALNFPSTYTFVGSATLIDGSNRTLTVEFRSVDSPTIVTVNKTFIDVMLMTST